MARWRIVFWCSIIAQMLACIMFLTYGSAEIQDWNNAETWENEERQRNNPRK